MKLFVSRMCVFLLVAVLLSACSPAAATDIPVQATAEPELAPAPTPIVHVLIPAEPVYFGSQAIPECGTGYRYQPGQPLSIAPDCDLWDRNRFERPASADLATYYPYIDLDDAQFGYAEPWYFGRLILYGLSDTELATYMLELDEDLDGRGDYLVVVRDLPLGGTEWTVSGVQVWQDSNNDVGGTTPIRPDSGPGDGYDLLIFDQGLGDDADLAWARWAPDHPGAIEFAFKADLTGAGRALGWTGWALRGSFDPTRFDLVDSLAETAVAGVDNTCAWVINGAPNGLRNQCQIVQPEPTPAPLPACVQPAKPSQDPCWIWIPSECRWVCFN